MMDVDRIRIRALIELLASGSGARQTPVIGPVSYRPNHNFLRDVGDPEMAIGFIELDKGQSLAPGQSIETDMTLILRQAVVGLVHVGRRWKIQEGHRLVGWGTVLDIIETGN